MLSHPARPPLPFNYDSREILLIFGSVGYVGGVVQKYDRKGYFMSDINRFSVMAVLANVYDPLCDVGRTPESELLLLI